MTLSGAVTSLNPGRTNLGKEIFEIGSGLYVLRNGENFVAVVIEREFLD